MQLLERNPEFAQVINNPQLLRESMQLAANPVCHPSWMFLSQIAMSLQVVLTCSRDQMKALQILLVS